MYPHHLRKDFLCDAGHCMHAACTLTNDKTHAKSAGPGVLTLSGTWQAGARVTGTGGHHTTAKPAV